MKIWKGRTYIDRIGGEHTIHFIGEERLLGRYRFQDYDDNYYDEDGNAEPHNVMDRRTKRPLDLVEEVQDE